MLRSFKLGSIFCDLLLADFLPWSPGNPHEQSKTLNCNLCKQHRNRVKCLYCCPNNDNNNNNKGETHKKLLSSFSWPKQCFSFRLDCCYWLVGNNHRASEQPTTHSLVLGHQKPHSPDAPILISLSKRIYFAIEGIISGINLSSAAIPIAATTFNLSKIVLVVSPPWFSSFIKER